MPRWLTELVLSKINGFPGFGSEDLWIPWISMDGQPRQAGPGLLPAPGRAYFKHPGQAGQAHRTYLVYRGMHNPKSHFLPNCNLRYFRWHFQDTEKLDLRFRKIGKRIEKLGVLIEKIDLGIPL